MNAWLGGFESILKRMTPNKFNWFLHSMLFYHTRYVIKKQEKAKHHEQEKEDEGEGEGEDEDEE